MMALALMKGKTMKTSTILRRALRLLGPNGERWGRGAYRIIVGRKVCYCAIGAIRKISEGDFRAEITLADSIQSPVSSVGDWNDRARSFVTIRRGFERAIKRAEKEEAKR
jgi:hypothetical protein